MFAMVTRVQKALQGLDTNKVLIINLGDICGTSVALALVLFLTLGSQVSPENQTPYEPRDEPAHKAEIYNSITLGHSRVFDDLQEFIK